MLYIFIFIKDQWIANELMMDFSVFTAPPMYIGRWRMKVIVQYDVDDVKTTDCAYIYGELDIV